MTQPLSLDARFERARAELTRRGQEHVLRWWDKLDANQREQLLTDIESIPWTALDPVMDSHIRKRPAPAEGEALAPAPVHPATPGPHEKEKYDAARRQGQNLLRAGKVAAFTVAGGQGTRLGVSGPKGMVPVTPIRHKTLFHLFAELIVAARRRYEAPIPWYIMTSPANHQATLDYLRGQSYFGLPESDVVLFPQGTLPVFELSGRLLMDDRHRISLGPDGHGGSLKALVQSGAARDMRSRGISTISYFQVDNPLAKPFEPLFLGLHAMTESQMSTKVTRKAHDLEKVGNLCLSGGRLRVIEYTEMPESLARERNSDGSRKFDAANLAMHALDLDFVESVAGSAAGLPLRRAEKAIPYIDDTGRRIEPTAPNAVKLETFVFDVLPLARNPMLLEVDRGEEFSPVKNASGVDSLETSQRDQVTRACRWLEQCGRDIPRRSDGTLAVEVEISALFASDVEELAMRAAEIPHIREGSKTYVE